MNNGFKRKSSELIIPKEVDCEDYASNSANVADLQLENLRSSYEGKPNPTNTNQIPLTNSNFSPRRFVSFHEKTMSSYVKD